MSGFSVRGPLWSAGAALLIACLAATGCGGGAAGPDAGSGPDGRAAVDAATGGAPRADAGSEGAGEPLLGVMTFNIKHAELSSLDEIAGVILESGVDIVALQEVDRDAARSGDTFQSYRLGQLTGMASSFRTAIPLPDGGRYGLALLSRHPILSSEKLNMTSAGEQRILVAWVVDLGGGRKVTIANTHFGLSEEERASQADEAVDFLAGRSSVVFLGDFNEESDGPAVYSTVTADYSDAWIAAGQGEGFTIPSTLPSRRIDYVFLSSDWDTPTEAEVYETTASDHRPVIVRMPRPEL